VDDARFARKSTYYVVSEIEILLVRRRLKKKKKNDGSWRLS